MRVNLFNPGPHPHRHARQAFPGEDPMTLPRPRCTARVWLQLALPSCALNGEWVAGDLTCQADERDSALEVVLSEAKDPALAEDASVASLGPSLAQDD